MQTSVFTLGGMRFLPPRVSSEQMAAIVRRALELGINHIETARGYGQSEELLGSIMHTLPRERLYITTKICPTDTEEEMWRYINESLTRMKLSWIDNFDYHGINTTGVLDECMRKDGCRRAVDRAVSEGLIRHVGFSTHGPLEVILDAINTQEFESVNLHYYYFNQRNRAAVERAAELDMGVFIISPADKGGQLFAPPPLLSALTAPLHPLVFNQRWLLGLHPYVHSLSFAPSFVEEFEPHIAGFDLDGPLTQEEQRILASMDARFSVLGADRCTLCWECLPCPENINIPETLRLRNMAKAFDMVAFGQFRYKMFEHAGHWFPGVKGNKCTKCGDCLPRCPEKLDIPKLLFETHDLLATEEEGRRLFEKEEPAAP
jgi:uncharacterized protein